MKQDIDVVFDSITGLRDIAIGADGDLQSVDDFSTSVDLSILTNQRANSSEVPQPTARRGWIGDLTPKTRGRKVGSKVWLFEQARRDLDTINGIRDAVQDGLQWLIDEGQVDRIEVSASASGFNGVFIKVTFSIGNNIINRYFNLWNRTEERSL